MLPDLRLEEEFLASLVAFDGELARRVASAKVALARTDGRALLRINSRRLRECGRGGVRAARRFRAVTQSTDWTEPVRGSSAAGYARKGAVAHWGASFRLGGTFLSGLPQDRKRR